MTPLRDTSRTRESSRIWTPGLVAIACRARCRTSASGPSVRSALRERCGINEQEGHDLGPGDDRQRQPSRLRHVESNEAQYDPFRKDGREPRGQEEEVPLPVPPVCHGGKKGEGAGEDDEQRCQHGVLHRHWSPTTLSGFTSSCAPSCKWR